MAWAYQWNPGTPMQAVIEHQAILAANPDHVEANFNFAMMQTRIGRYERAAELFQRVVSLTDHENPIHQRAATELEAVQAAGPSAPLPTGPVPGAAGG